MASHSFTRRMFAQLCRLIVVPSSSAIFSLPPSQLFFFLLFFFLLVLLLFLCHLCVLMTLLILHLVHLVPSASVHCTRLPSSWSSSASFVQFVRASPFWVRRLRRRLTFTAMIKPLSESTYRRPHFPAELDYFACLAFLILFPVANCFTLLFLSLLFALLFSIPTKINNFAEVSSSTGRFRIRFE